jgi:hypothetical protein
MINPPAMKRVILSTLATLVFFIFGTGAGCGSLAPPVLTGTMPLSPSNSTFPQVLGSAEGGTNIEIYTQADCAGPVAATGKADSNTGDFAITVDVTVGTTVTFSARAYNDLEKSDCSSETFSYLALDNPSFNSTTADSAVNSTGPFKMSVPDGSGYLDLSFTEDTFIPGTFTSTQVDASGSSSALSGGTIRFFNGTPINASTTFDFARLVAIKQTSGSQRFYFVGTYDSVTVYANWAAGDTNVTIQQLTLASSDLIGKRTTPVKTISTGLVLDSKTVAAYGTAADARLEILALAYLADGVFFGELGLHVAPSQLLVYDSATNDPFTATTDTDLLTQFASWGAANFAASPDAYVMLGADVPVVTPTAPFAQDLSYVESVCTTNRFGYTTTNPAAPLSDRMLAIVHSIGHVIGGVSPEGSTIYNMQDTAAVSLCTSGTGGTLAMCPATPSGLKFTLNEITYEIDYTLSQTAAACVR